MVGFRRCAKSIAGVPKAARNEPELAIPHDGPRIERSDQRSLDQAVGKISREPGVRFYKSSPVDHFNFDGRAISGAVINQPDGPVKQADYYLLAVPTEIAAGLFTPEMIAAARSLGKVGELETRWMNGIQFYLKRNVDGCKGHVICLDSKWALTCIAQPQFWGGTDFSQYGDGQVRGLISVDVSDWLTAGDKTTNKCASECTSPDEIMEECWAQLVAHFSCGKDPLVDGDRHDWHLDPDIVVFSGGGGPPRRQ
jgi:15-cis-phytoene desaturase